MRSKWILAVALSLAVLSTGISCREIQQEDLGVSSDSAFGSTSSSVQISPAHVAGSWSLILIDAATGRNRYVNVEMSQTDDVIFGRGSTGGSDVSTFPVQTEPKPTKDDGIESMIWWLEQDPDPTFGTTAARSLTIGASGLVIGQSLSLDLIFLEENALYRLNLNAAGSSISGSYLAYDSVGRIQSGSCYGSTRAGYGQSVLSLGSNPEVITLGGMRSL